MSSQNYRSSESHEDYDEEDSTSQPDSLDDDHPAHERVKAIYSSPFSPHTPYANENFRMFEAPQRLVYKSEFITPPARGRHEKRIPFNYERSRSAGRDSQPVLVHRPGVTYVRSRSQSPHILRPRQRYSKHDLDTIMAIQQGMEKRQRAIRLSLYKAASVDDLDWEM